MRCPPHPYLGCALIAGHDKPTNAGGHALCSVGPCFTYTCASLLVWQCCVCRKARYYTQTIRTCHAQWWKQHTRKLHMAHLKESLETKTRLVCHLQPPLLLVSVGGAPGLLKARGTAERACWMHRARSPEAALRCIRSVCALVLVAGAVGGTACARACSMACAVVVGVRILLVIVTYVRYPEPTK